MTLSSTQWHGSPSGGGRAGLQLAKELAAAPMEMTKDSAVSFPPEALDALTSLLGKRATTSESHRQNHSAGESYHKPELPDVVCYPRTTQEVSQVLKISARYGVCVVPFGAGTSVEGQVNALQGGISIDLREMNRLIDLSVADMDATVEAGMTRLELNRHLKDTGLAFFIDPGADATIGGMAATRASGTTAVRYGTMRENVLGLTVVLADGNIIRTGSHARKSSSGYDLTHLFVGSEGTLGVVTEVILRLQPLPEAVSTATCCFASVQNAVETAIEAIQLGLNMARIEFLDDRQIAAVNRFSKTNLTVAPTLFFEFHGLTDEEISYRAELLRSIAKEHGATQFEWQKRSQDREVLWKARHDAYHAAHALRPNSKIWTTDVCVPISRLAECIVATQDEMNNLPFPTTMVGHVGDGNFHVLCVLEDGSSSDLEEAARFSERLVTLALTMGGTCTGEHGVGYGKMRYLQQEHGEALDVMRAIKRALDPNNRLNPGKIVDLGNGRST